MTIKLGIIMDPIENIKFRKDTSLVLLLAAAERGWQLYYMLQKDLSLEQGIPVALTRPLEVFDDENCWFKFGEQVELPLGNLDVLLMRKDPPFNAEYIYTTYILEAAENLGVLVVNKPQSLRDCNEKVFATRFPQCCPPVLVSRDEKRLRAFHAEHDQVIFKPLEGMGGTSVFLSGKNDPNLSVILETLTDFGRRTIMAQRYIPEIRHGDKRILVVDGEAVPFCLARIPQPGELRGNLAAGGTGVVQPLNERDRWIVDQVAPALVEKGLLFVGLDVIGDFLTEINVTSPTCAREIDNAERTAIGHRLMDAIERRLA